jgi:hypothetical protein
MRCYRRGVRDRYARVIFHLHVEHTPPSLDRAVDASRDLIDLDIARGASYYLTYHRWRAHGSAAALLCLNARVSAAETTARSG